MTGRDGTYAVDDDSEHLLRNVRQWHSYCTARSGGGLYCTRRAKHDGQHEAAGLGVIWGVWP